MACSMFVCFILSLSLSFTLSPLSPSLSHVSHIKFLGVIVDNNLSWAYHIKEITSKMAKSIYQLARIKNFIDERCRKTFYHAYIHNKLEYGILLFGGAAAHQLRPLKSLQKRAVKLVVKNSSTNVFKAACVLPFQSLTDFQRSLLIMKSTNDKVPQYIKALFTLCPNGNNRFRLPLPRLDIYKSHSISFSAVMSWNSLPINIRSSMRSISLNNFKRKLGNYLLRKV